MMPPVILVMGVAGSGKTTLATALASSLRGVVVDADDLHAPADVERMRRGVPLDDAARLPWLGRVRAAIEAELTSGIPVVVACSALKARYRTVLLAGLPDAVIVWLRVDRATLDGRLRGRRGHFMPASLLDSQLADLEPPRDAITLDGGLAPGALVALVRRELGEDDGVVPGGGPPIAPRDPLRSARRSNG